MSGSTNGSRIFEDAQFSGNSASGENTDMSENITQFTVILTPGDAPNSTTSTSSSDVAALAIIISGVILATCLSFYCMLQIMRRLVTGFKKIPSLAQDRDSDLHRLRKTQQILQLRREVKVGVVKKKKALNQDSAKFRNALTEEKKEWRFLNKIVSRANSYELQDNLVKQMGYLYSHRKVMVSIYGSRCVVIASLVKGLNQAGDKVRLAKNVLSVMGLSGAREKDRKGSVRSEKYGNYERNGVHHATNYEPTDIEKKSYENRDFRVKNHQNRSGFQMSHTANPFLFEFRGRTSTAAKIKNAYGNGPVFKRATSRQLYQSLMECRIRHTKETVC